MQTKFDVFKKHAGGAWWVQTLATEADARSLVKGLMTHWPTEYVILNQETGEKILIKPDLRSKNHVGLTPLHQADINLFKRGDLVVLHYVLRVSKNGDSSHLFLSDRSQILRAFLSSSANYGCRQLAGDTQPCAEKIKSPKVFGCFRSKGIESNSTFCTVKSGGKLTTDCSNS